MNKFYIDREAYFYLNSWAAENKTSTIWSPYYFKNVEVVLIDSDFRFFIEAQKEHFKFNLKNKSGLVYSGKITHDTSGKNDFIICFKPKMSLDYPEQYGDVLETFCNAFFNANCFMWYGNLVSDKRFTAAGKNSGKDKIITFRKFKDTVYAVPIGSHRSPEGVFGVRGHFRKNKNGKIIWIDDYMKGLKNEKSS